MGQSMSGRKGNIKFADTAGTVVDTAGVISITAPAEVKAIANMGSWKLDIDFDTIETPVFGMGGWKTAVAGLQSWSGSAEGYFDTADTTGQAALRTASLAGKETYMEFDLDDAHKYIGNAYIKKISIDTSSSDVIKFNIDIQGNGALIYS